MKSPRTITLFTEHTDFRRPPTSLAVSLLLHGSVFGLATFGILYTPPIDGRAIMDRYQVRRLDLQMPDEQARRLVDELAYPGPHQPTHAHASGADQPAPSLTMPPIPKARPSRQTLVQPDQHIDAALTQEVPLPQVVLWSPSKTPVVKIVAPLPQKPPTAIVKPSLAPPVEEVNLSDVAIASVPQPALKQLIVPSTTTPIAVRGPQQPQPTTPATVSQPAAKPTSATVVSLSDLRMKNGTVTLPPANEAPKANADGPLSLVPGPAKNAAVAGNGASAAKAAGSGAGKSAGTHTGDAPPNSSTAQSDSAAPGAGQTPGSVAGAGPGGQISATVISLPREGKFSAIIVGASLEDEYPEISDVWRGRMTYTVYLHVGLEKSWILQYSLPRAADAAAAGAVVRLDAPWPYNIVRPNLAPGAIDADALMVHGFVNNDGRFETLSIVFPNDFPGAQFVLDALARWQFRPASENGQIAKVEVLLIIPEQYE